MSQLNPDYGTERCPHICHLIYNRLRTGLVYTFPRHCPACDGGGIVATAEAKERGLIETFVQDFERAGLLKGDVKSQIPIPSIAEIRRQWEDEVLRTHGDLPDWKLAVIYAWLHGRGMRMDDTEKMIREGLRKEPASK